MKKLFITLAFVAATFFCQAQFYVGGSLGLSGTGGKTTVSSSGSELSTNDPKGINFTIAPSVGYMFSDNLGAGLDLGLGFGREKYEQDVAGTNYTIKDKATEWGVAPYLRCVFGDFDNVKLYADLRASFGGLTPKYSVEGNGEAHEEVGDKEFNFGIGVVPGIAYYLNDNIFINARLNLFELGYQMSKVESVDEDTNVTTTKKSNIYGLGVNNQTALSIGFYYAF